MPENERPIESVLIDYVLHMISECETATLLQRFTCLRDILETLDDTAFRYTKVAIVRAACRIREEVPDDF